MSHPPPPPRPPMPPPGPYQAPYQGPPPRRPVRVGRVMAGIGIALAGHLLTLVVSVAGAASGNTDVSVAGFYTVVGGQLLLAAACLVVGIVLTVRQDGGFGVGLLIGWGVGLLFAPVVGIGLCLNALSESGWAG